MSLFDFALSAVQACLQCVVAPPQPVYVALHTLCEAQDDGYDEGVHGEVAVTLFTEAALVEGEAVDDRAAGGGGEVEGLEVTEGEPGVEEEDEGEGDGDVGNVVDLRDGREGVEELEEEESGGEESEEELELPHGGGQVGVEEAHDGESEMKGRGTRVHGSRGSSPAPVQSKVGRGLWDNRTADGYDGDVVESDVSQR